MSTATNVTRIQDLSGQYTLDPSHSRIGFVARHAMIAKVRGSFNDVSGVATINPADLASSTLEVTINPASVDTRDANRDGHLKGADFFDVETYPTITFVGTDFKIEDDQTVVVTGDLTIKGTTAQVSIPFEFGGAATDPFGNDRIGFEGQVQVNRKDWGLTWNAALEAGGVLVSDKVTLEFEVSAIRS